MHGAKKEDEHLKDELHSHFNSSERFKRGYGIPSYQCLSLKKDDVLSLSNETQADIRVRNINPNLISCISQRPPNSTLIANAKKAEIRVRNINPNLISCISQRPSNSTLIANAKEQSGFQINIKLNNLGVENPSGRDSEINSTIDSSAHFLELTTPQNNRKLSPTFQPASCKPDVFAPPEKTLKDNSANLTCDLHAEPQLSLLFRENLPPLPQNLGIEFTPDVKEKLKKCRKKRTSSYQSRLFSDCVQITRGPSNMKSKEVLTIKSCE